MASLSPFTGTLTQKQAIHLLRRTTFGPNKTEINQFTGKSISQALDILFAVSTETIEAPIDIKTGENWVSPKRSDLNSDEGDLMGFLMTWWLERMRTKGLNIAEKMTHFLHTHFTTSTQVVESSTAIYWQIRLYQFYALGNFKTLASKVCTDNAMIKYLDANSNVYGSPQENFAREFLELFTIGKGKQVGASDYTNYTEQDIKEAARVLSGYNTDDEFTNIDPITLFPRGIIKTNTNIRPQSLTSPANQHDEGTKTFSGSLGNGTTTITPATLVGENATIEAVYGELEALIQMIFDKEETSKHICRKLYRYFVYYQITDEIEQDIIEPLAQTFRDNDFELVPVLKQLLQSQHFFDLDNTILTDDTKGAIIKSPLELLMGTLRFFEVDFGDTTNLSRLYTIYGDVMSDLLKDMGLAFYQPYDVAGHEAYHQFPEYNRYWITASNLGYRYQMIDRLLMGFFDKDNNDLGIKLDSMKLILNTNNVADPGNPEDILNFFVNHLYPQSIRQERFDYFRDRILLDNLSIANWYNEWTMYKSSGDDTAVRAQLNALVRELIQTPEYQLF